jgi:hypothetical protein
MSDRSDDIREAVRQLAGTHLVDKTHVAVAQVVSVDIDACTCVVLQVTGQTSATRTASLMTDVGDGFLLIPAIDSTVIIAWSDRNRPYVAMFSDLQDVYLDATGKITMNQGVLGGLVKVRDLVTKLNTIENKLNQMIASYNAHVHPDPVSGITGAPTVPITGTLTPTQVVDIENPNVTHG